SGPHVRSQHDLGRHLQRSRADQLLRRSPPSAQELQVQHRLCPHRYHHHDHPRLRALYPLRLADQGLHRHFAHEHRVRQSLPAAHRAQSGYDAVYVL
ncbi:hypothetical protein LTR33_001362, partial [Friedmanniomyces endolithicus]